MLLQTERLILRRFRPEDAPMLAAYRSDPDVARYQSWTAPLAPEDAESMVQEMAEGDPQAPGWFQYAMQLKEDPALIGDVGVGLNQNLKQAEIGFTMAPEWQGHGYASEAVRAIVGHLFDRGLRRVSAECDARNVASARLLTRVGFKLEGRRPAYTWIKDEWTDDLLFGLLREWWVTPR